MQVYPKTASMSPLPKWHELRTLAEQARDSAIGAQRPCSPFPADPSVQHIRQCNGPRVPSSPQVTSISSIASSIAYRK